VVILSLLSTHVSGVCTVAGGTLLRGSWSCLLTDPSAHGAW